MYALTFTTGLIDAVTILGLGDIFASLMTGNVVFIGLGLGGFEDVSPLRSLFAIITFIGGAILGGFASKKLSNKKVGGWLVIISLAEVVLLLLASWSVWNIGPNDTLAPTSIRLMIAISMTSFAMGVRNSTIQKLSIADLKVTVLTLGISGLGSDFGSGKSDIKKQTRRIISILMIGTGAGFGALLFFKFGVAIPLCITAMIIFISTVLFSLTKEGKSTLTELKNIN
jgi:uncharacterized membrane protein YoaK (UPF0700 family)